MRGAHDFSRYLSSVVWCWEMRVGHPLATKPIHCMIFRRLSQIPSRSEPFFFRYVVTDGHRESRNIYIKCCLYKMHFTYVECHAQNRAFLLVALPRSRCKSQVIESTWYMLPVMVAFQLFFLFLSLRGLGSLLVKLLCHTRVRDAGDNSS